MPSQQPSIDIEHLEIWTDEGQNDGARYEAFRRWARTELSRRLCWPRNHEERVWQVAACINSLEDFCGQLSRDGFLFDGRELAAIMLEQIDRVAMRQRQEVIINIFSFLRKGLQNYTKTRTEDIKRRAVLVGAHINQWAFGPFDARPKSMVEILAEKELSRRQRALEERRYRKAVKKEQSRQIDLFSELAAG